MIRRFTVRPPRNLAHAAAFKDPGAPSDIEGDADVQLMLAVQRDDRGAFQQLFEKHISGVIGFAMQFVANRARSEELAQDVFLQLYRTRARYVPRARFKTWLYRMVTNACLSELRRPEHRARVQSLDHPVRERSDDPPTIAEPSTPSSEAAALDHEAVQSLQAAVAHLPPQQRAALLLARANGLSYEEVASSLSCSVSAVKSLIHRATVTLREQLQEEDV
jgi:RNA polymerase sigma-70 factor, ECF subfamily